MRKCTQLQQYCCHLKMAELDMFEFLHTGRKELGLTGKDTDSVEGETNADSLNYLCVSTHNESRYWYIEMYVSSLIFTIFIYTRYL